MSKYASKYIAGAGNADTLDGLHADAFSLAAHDHTTMAHVNGVPLNHQIAFWEGANTLAGEAGFEWDSTDMKVPGNVRAAGEVVAYDSGAAGPVIWDGIPVDNVTLKYAANVISIKPAIGGNALKFLRVDAAGTGIEWAAGSGGGVTDHSDLAELDYASAAHTGFSPTVHNLINTTNHPVAGLTAGHFLKATGAATYAFAAHGLGVADITGAAPLVSPIFTGTGSWDSPTLVVDATNHRVGFGTANPISPVDIRGTLNVAYPTNTYGATPTINLNAANAQKASIQGFVETDGPGSGSIIFNTLNPGDSFGERVRIFSNGYVGFGTISPSEIIHVVGNILATGQLKSSIAIGTAPLAITSTTKVNNLHVERATLADTVAVAATADASCSVALFESPTGNMAVKTDTGITYNANTDTLILAGDVICYG